MFCRSSNFEDLNLIHSFNVQAPQSMVVDEEWGLPGSCHQSKEAPHREKLIQVVVSADRKVQGSEEKPRTPYHDPKPLTAPCRHWFELHSVQPP